MKTENLHCDFCKKVTTSYGKKIENLNGFCAELGYSTGGWGYRKNFVTKQSWEICDKCFDEVCKISKELSDKIRQLKS